jgi:hypothetical protein
MNATAPGTGRSGRTLRIVALVMLTAAGACDRIWPQKPDLSLPAIADVRAIYRANGLDRAEIAYNGNIVEVRVTQPPDQLRRGGSLWARVGPWIYLLTPGTRKVFQDFAGIAAVRVITTAGRKEVARATLRNGALSEVLWRRTLNILGHALQEGTRSPARLQELAEWGERYGEYEYSADYVPR